MTKQMTNKVQGVNTENISKKILNNKKHQAQN